MFNKEQIGVNAFNSLFNCQMIYQEFTVDNNFISDSPYVINKGESDSSLGNYDFNLNQRVKNNVDIGAIEA